MGKMETGSFAVSMDYAFNDSWTLTLGGRYKRKGLHGWKWRRTMRRATRFIDQPYADEWSSCPAIR